MTLKFDESKCVHCGVCAGNGMTMKGSPQIPDMDAVDVNDESLRAAADSCPVDALTWE